MKPYQVFVLKMEGQVRERYELKCTDDADAAARTKMFFTTYSVELWDGLRLVVRIPAKQ